MNQRFQPTLWRVICLFICFFYKPSWSNSCQSFTTIKEILTCIVEVHPRIIAAKLEVTKTENLENLARQRQNPNLSTRNLFPASSQANGINTEIDLSQSFELGGKRQGRIESARVEKKISLTSLRIIEENVLIETLMNLYRLRQIENELEIYDETLLTYGHIQKQFKRRSQLTPEQQVATSVFHLAEGDILFQKTSVLSEKNAILSELEYALGQKLSIQVSQLPMFDLSVKNIPTTEKTNSLLEQSKALVSLSQAELINQKAQRYPNFSFGPSYDGNSLGSASENHTLGFNFSIGIPIVQTNKAGVALAKQEVSIAEKNLELQQRATNAQKQKWKSQYDLAMTVLESGIKSQDIELKHKKIESLYDRGFLPSSMVIEAHRQVLDYARHQHDQEILALEARFKLYTLEGRLFEEIL